MLVNAFLPKKMMANLDFTTVVILVLHRCTSGAIVRSTFFVTFFLENSIMSVTQEKESSFTTFTVYEIPEAFF